MTSEQQECLQFEIPPLDDAVGIGLVGHDWATVWVRASSPGPHRVEIYDAARKQRQIVRFNVSDAPKVDGTASTRCELSVPSAAPARFQYQVVRDADDFLLGAGEFETAPETDEETPDEFSFLVVSCHHTPLGMSLRWFIERTLSAPGTHDKLARQPQLNDAENCAHARPFGDAARLFERAALPDRRLAGGFG